VRRLYRALATRRWWALAALIAIGGPALALAAAFPSVLRIPRRDPGAGNPLPRALFSHATHGGFLCFRCHPSTFPQAPLAFTHQEMNEGRFCGRCHDGHGAFAINTASCAGCHVTP
jgi:c(7)-type cytochrome triheme protein